MILLLDPFDSITRISEDKNECIKALSQNYFVLSRLQNELLEKISEIKILNFLGELCPVDNVLYEKFIKKSVKKSDILYPLFLKPSIHSITGLQDIYKLTIPLSSENNQFIFFNTLLSNGLVWCLSEFPNVVGYRLVKKDNLNKWMEIMDISRYLDISIVLNCRSINKESFSEYLKYNKKDIIEGYIQYIINEIENNNFTKHFCISNDWNEDDQDKIISTLKNKFGLFESYFCKPDKKYNLPISDRLTIHNFQYLDKENQTKLLKEISNAGYKERLVIIFSSEAADLREYPQIKGWVSSEGFLGITDTILKQIFNLGKIIDEKIAEYENFINTLMVTNREKKKFNKRLNNFAGGGDHFNAEKVDFWYDLKSMELYDIESMKKWAIPMFQKNIPEFTKKKFVFTQEGIYWYIKVNDIEPVTVKERKEHQINYMKNNAIRYIVYLIKHTSIIHPISFEDLSKSIYKWKSDEEKIVKRETITESIGDLFKSYKFLKPIEKYLDLDKNGKGFYYLENSEIEIDFTDIEIPFIHLDK